MGIDLAGLPDVANKVDNLLGAHSKVGIRAFFFFLLVVFHSIAY